MTTTDRLLYNPDDQDFTTTYDLDGDNHGESWDLPAGEIKSFPAAVADHIQHHLTDRLIRKRGVKTNYLDDYELVRKELEVDL